MGKLKFAITNIWFWLTMAIGCFFVENIALLNPEPTKGFDFTTFWLFAIAAFACAIMYIVLERKKNHIGVDKILLPTMVVLFIIMLCTIWVQGTQVFPFKDGSDQIVVSFSLEQKVQYSVMLLFVFVFTYMSTAMMFSNRTSNRSLRWLPFLYILFTYITIVYSLYKEWDEYVHFFTGEVPNAKSFYLNSNTLAIAIFIGILSCMVFNYYKTTIFANVTIIVFTIAGFFTNCATSFLLTIVVVPLYFVINIVHNAKQNYIKTAIYFAIALTIYLSLTSYFMFHGDWMKGIDENLKRFMDTLDFDTFTHRSYIWVNLIEKSIDTPAHALFGHGFKTGDIILHAVCCADNSSLVGGSHSGENGFVNILFNYGLIGLVVYVLLLAYFCYCLICIVLRKKYYPALMYGICFISLVAYDMLEQNNFFDMGFKETYMTLVFFMPIIHMHKMDIHQSKVKEFKNLPFEGIRNFYHFPHAISMILAGLTAASGAGLLITGVYKMPQLFNALLYVTIGLGASLLILPYLIYLWLVNKGISRGRVHVALNLMLISFVTFFVWFIFKYNMLIGAIALVVNIVGDVVIYAIMEKDYFRSYFKVSIFGSIVTSLLPMAISIGLTFLLAFLFHTKTEYNMLTYIAFMVVAFVFYGMAIFIIPCKNNKKTIEYMNNILLSQYRTQVKLERRNKVCLKNKVQAVLK